ncbi:hypothetical protein SAMN05421505_10653 [Sinosporangium album]|uniref:4-amino-4-deoxy-L-arabinose transferase n=1 Tax=Sinosporangium album TaxID=504805 RepID=A0A1G7VVB0_9ACTN|nr:hypothetical protein [Sinosporangium album]SDG63349.1 hypothetical protein SAMN05421505_10653 [Sinosporangium album]
MTLRASPGHGDRPERDTPHADGAEDESRAGGPCGDAVPTATTGALAPRARSAAGPLLAAACVLIAAAVCWKWVVLSNGYFREDDFEYTVRGFENALDLDYLTRVHWGQLMPGGFALAWLLARVAPYNWELTSAITLAGHALAALAAFRMLRVLFGSRPAILAPLAVYLFTPLTLPALGWWAAALNLVPLQIAAPMAVSAHVLYLRTGCRGHLWAATGWITFGLLCFLKAGAIPLILFGLTLGWFAGRGGTGGAAALKDTVWRHRRAWTMYAVPLAAYAVVYLSRLGGSGTRISVTALGDVAEFARRLITETFPATAVGATWDWSPVGTGGYALAAPAAPHLRVALAATVAVVAASLLLSRGAWRAWALLVCYLVCADVLPIALGRLSPGSVGLAGAETRYTADAAFVLMLCLSLAFLPVEGTERRVTPLRRLTARAAVPVTAVALTAFTASSLWSGTRLVAAVDGRPARGYVETARAQLAAASHDADIFDRPVPSHVAGPLFGAYAHTSHVLAPLAKPIHRRTMRTQPPSEHPLVLDDTGRLTPLSVRGTRRTPPSGLCWPQAGNAVDIPVRGMTAAGESTHIVKLEHISQSEILVSIAFGRGRISTAIPHGLKATTFGVTGGGGARLRLIIETPGSSVCVTAATVGVAVPKR